MGSLIWDEERERERGRETGVSENVKHLLVAVYLDSVTDAFAIRLPAREFHSGCGRRLLRE
jgi:hypothetical protein